MIELFLPAALFSIVLVAIHSYFGLEVIKRGVIFSDLAIGQAAAIGIAISLIFFNSNYIFTISISFAILFATLIVFMEKSRVNREAFIGLLYVLGASALMLILSQSPSASEHFLSILATDILFMTTQDIIYTSAIYLIISLLIIYLLPRLNGVVRDLLFFWLFALTVTLSVNSVGVLVVFAILIAPALTSTMQNRFNRVMFSTIFGSIVVVLSIVISYFYDLPIGYAIVFFTSLVTIILALLKRVVEQE